MPADSAHSTDEPKIYDFVVIGSGFGGSVSAMRLSEKGYRVLVLERGKRYRDEDFATTNWDLPKFLWLPAMRCFGIFEMTFLNGLLAFHGSGVGGGSLTYANVLMEPDEKLFEAPAWRHLADWKTILRPHYDTTRRMLGVARNPRQSPADQILKGIADDLGVGDTFELTDVGVFFGESGREGESVPDPYFGGEGPNRAGCTHCGGCMVGCQHNAKNTLVKNYLFFAEKWGAVVRPECRVVDIRSLAVGGAGDARFEILYRSSTAFLFNPTRSVQARNIVVAAGTLGTLQLLFACRDVTRSLPRISSRLGYMVRTNSETILGAAARRTDTDYSQGIAITSVFHADEVTRIQPVRYPEGSSFLRILAAPLIDFESNILLRFAKTLWEIIRHPLDFVSEKFLPHWAQRTTLLLVMQTEDNLTRMQLGRNIFTLFRRGLVIKHSTDKTIPPKIAIGSEVTRRFAKKMNGIPRAVFTDTLFNFPSTAHMLGGVSFGQDDAEGVISLDCEVHNYPGLYVVDGSILPANPGINPSLTIAALAEYAMSRIPPKEGYGHEQPAVSALAASRIPGRK